MKTYIGKKTVQAEPMTAAEFKEKTGRNPVNTGYPDNADEMQGYLVQYEDGYQSWSPKETFEKAYKCSDDLLDKLQIEYDELHDKVVEIVLFMNSNDFKELDYQQQALVKAQCYTMQAYKQILAERIRTNSKRC